MPAETGIQVIIYSHFVIPPSINTLIRISFSYWSNLKWGQMMYCMWVMKEREAGFAFAIEAALVFYIFAYVLFCCFSFYFSNL